MKTKLITTILIIAMFFCVACEKTNNNTNPEPTASIIGSWKLMQKTVTVKYANQEIGQDYDSTFDYYSENVIYNFQTDSTLIVSTQISDLLSAGEHKYKYTPTTINQTIMQNNLLIDDTILMFCFFAQNNVINIGSHSFSNGVSRTINTVCLK